MKDSKGTNTPGHNHKTMYLLVITPHSRDKFLVCSLLPPYKYNTHIIFYIRKPTELYCQLVRLFTFNNFNIFYYLHIIIPFTLLRFSLILSLRYHPTTGSHLQSHPRINRTFTHGVLLSP